MLKSLSVIVPIYNEEINIPVILPPIIAFCKDKGWKLILVNDGSEDKSKEILQSYDNEDFVLIINHKVNRGYGGAIKSGIFAAETDYCVTIDADGQHVLEDIEKLYFRIHETNADMILGSRRGLKSANILRRIGKGLIRLFARMMMPLKVYDLNSGMRIFDTKLGKKVAHLSPDGMSFSDTFTLIFVSFKYLVLEEKISIRDRLAGESKVKLNTAFETVLEILNIMVLFNPLRIFLPLSILFFIFGFIWSIHILLKGEGISIGASFLMIMGVLFFSLGFISEQITQIRKKS
ncbi:MAG TPA: glycosyltransferase family 2 protein [Candidatus Cloacimonadota bacterium]|nr:glycosyltransferase family 2 protein [Candidatus Cloacimonadota bacterium]